MPHHGQPSARPTFSSCRSRGHTDVDTLVARRWFHVAFGRLSFCSSCSRSQAPLEGFREFRAHQRANGFAHCCCRSDGCIARAIDTRRWPRASEFGCWQVRDARPVRRVRMKKRTGVDATLFQNPPSQRTASRFFSPATASVTVTHFICKLARAPPSDPTHKPSIHTDFDGRAGRPRLRWRQLWIPWAGFASAEFASSG
jgi:hypothetical protein